MSATQMALPLQVPGASTLPDLSTYDRILVAFSGGKDSICCLLRLLELGVPRSKIEQLHLALVVALAVHLFRHVPIFLPQRFLE